MSRLPQLDPTTATGEAADLLRQVQATLGLTPNMTKVMANSPALLRSYLAMSGALATGVLPSAVRERLAIATAESNGCAYCLSAHTYIGANLAGVDGDELERARYAASEDPHVGAILELSQAILTQHGDVDDETWARVRALGVTDAEIGEIVGHLAVNVLTNYFNVLTRVENDWPAVTPRAQAA
jgi:uncharacterized peroxidase-related enzyme